MAIIIPIVAKFIDEGLDKAKASINEADGAWQKVGATMASLATPAKAIAVGMGGAAVKIAKNAGGAAKANAKLQSSFDAIGYPKQAQAAMDYAESLQHVIGVSDEEIKATQQKLAAFSKVASSQDTMARSTMAAADMAAAGFGTMDSAAVALGKAISNPEKALGALTRMGVQFTQEQRDQIKVWEKTGESAKSTDLILGQVESTFSGVAATSASGSAKMKLAWDEAAETLGTTLAPWLGVINEKLTAMAVFVNNNAAAILKWTGIIFKASVAIVALATAWKIVNTTMKVVKAAVAAVNAVYVVTSTVIGVITGRTALMTGAQLVNSGATKAQAVAHKALAVAYKVAGAAAKVFNLIMKSCRGPILLIISVVIALAVAIVKNWDQIKAVTQKVWNWIKTFLANLWNSIKQMATNVFQAIENVVKRAWEIIKRILSLNPFIAIIKHSEFLQRVIRTAFDWVRDKINTVWNWIKGLFNGNPFSGIQSALNAMKGWFSSAFGWIKGQIDSFLSTVNGMVDRVQDAFNRAKSIADKIPRPGGKSAPSSVASPYFAMPTVQSLTRGVPAPTATAVRQGGGGDGLTINVNGALDPEAVARQIRDLLDSHDRRNGRTVLRAVAF